MRVEHPADGPRHVARGDGDVGGVEAVVVRPIALLRAAAFAASRTASRLGIGRVPLPQTRIGDHFRQLPADTLHRRVVLHALGLERLKDDRVAVTLVSSSREGPSP